MDHILPELQAAVQRLHEVSFLRLIPFFPGLGALLLGIFGARLQATHGKRAVSAIAVGSMLVSTAVALYAFFACLLPLGPEERFLHDRAWSMIAIGSFQVDMAFAMDTLAGTMTLIVTVIGTAIHIYSTGYMHEEKAYWRYFAYLNLFCFSMLTLVLADNFILMFFGWEGVGLCSYLLIGFWYTDLAKARAGMKAFVVNRIGDFGFVCGAFLLFWGLGGAWAGHGFIAQTHAGEVLRVQAVSIEQVAPRHGAEGGHGGQSGHGGAVASPGELPPAHGAAAGEGRTGEAGGREGGATVKQAFIPLGPTLRFRELRQQLSITDADGRKPLAEQLAAKTVFGIPLLFLVGLCLFLGATGKSAQLPLYVWLPDAMAGPTPVSALIHAATMVTAGVYMVARLNFVFALSPGAMTVVATVGALTALFAATIGLFQHDIKKVLAYSTVSQLGYMFIGVGVGAYWAGIYHLLTHAFFKACLFLGSGSVIHGMHWVQHHGHGAGQDDAHGAHNHPETPPDPRLAPDPTDPQDMRNMGGLATLMPQTRMTYLVACIAIAGFPIAAGFFSKDEILWKAFANQNTLLAGPVLWLLGVCGAALTAFYMFRSYYMTFYFRPPTEDHCRQVHESPRSMTWVLWFLAAGSIATALIGLPKVFTHAEPIFERLLEPVMALAPVRFAENHALEVVLMLVSVGVATAGFLAARALYLDGGRRAEWVAALRARWDRLHRVVFNKYYVDQAYQATAVRGTVRLSRELAWFDLSVIDWAVNAWGYLLRAVSWIGGAIDRVFVDGAVNGVADLVIAGGRGLRRVQTGRINQYVYGVVAGVIVLVVITVLV